MLLFWSLMYLQLTVISYRGDAGCINALTDLSPDDVRKLST